MPDLLRRACVTGGAGFVGSHLVRALLARGLSVKVLDDLSVGKRGNVPDDAELIVGDILDPAAVALALAGCHIVFHLASRVAIRSSFDFAVEDTATNIVGTASVLRGVVNSGSVRRFIGTSSMAVYADAVSPVPVDEQHPLRPVSPYGISKLAAEQLTHAMCANGGIQSAMLRLFNTYGPGQAYSPYVGVVTIFVNKLMAGEIPRIFGDGEQCRDFVHVKDVVAGFVNAADSAVTGETFNIGTGTASTVNAVFEAVRRSLGSPVEAQHVAPVAGELRYSIADVRKARDLLGYRPQYVFRDCIDEVVADIAGGGHESG